MDLKGDNRKKMAHIHVLGNDKNQSYGSLTLVEGALVV